MPDFDDLIYDSRTMAERVNARLKRMFPPSLIRFFVFIVMAE